MKRSLLGFVSLAAAVGLFLVMPQNLEAAALKGHALKQGSTIAITAPASNVQDVHKNFLKKVYQRIEKEGYKVRVEPTTGKVYGSYAGTAAERAEELNRLFADKTVDAILCMRGGYGSAQMLDKLDYKIIAKNPKMLIGFSDITALHNAIYKKAKVVGVSGPMITRLINGSDYSWKHLLAGVKTKDALGVVPMPKGKQLQTLVAGTASGPIIGGNLCTFASIIGSPYQPPAKGAILVLEEVGESAYRIDRMLNQLYLAGILKDVNGIVFGGFTNCASDKSSFSVDEVIEKYAKLAGKPCVKNFPFGHDKDNVFLPIGVQAALNASKTHPTLTITEAHNK